ncbi:MAG: hypothetical protein GY765_12545, partial [bacterium]|nr:hypothetical protein [bacterium]
MKKFILFLSMLYVSAFFLTANGVVFSDLLKPTSLVVADEQIYITDGPSIYIHSAKDFKLINKFGKVGEGPQEFKVHPALNNGSVVID